MGRFVRFRDEDSESAWGEVESTDGERYCGRRLVAVPAEHDPAYFDALLTAFGSKNRGAAFEVEVASVLPPVGRPPLILAIGMNYQDHLDEMNAAKLQAGQLPSPQPTEPTLFFKAPGSVIGPEDPIIIPHMAPHQVDYEVELAVVIGREACNLSPADALDTVAFYTCGHDVSARDAQLEAPNGQWVRGKSFDTFCPLGPVAATDIDPSGLDVRLRLNGQVMQSSNTRHLIFDVPHLISYLSHNMTLSPGTVLMTGTPGGVGHFLAPPVYLTPGDVVEVEISGIGVLRNPVIADDYSGAIPTTQFA